MKYFLAFSTGYSAFNYWIVYFLMVFVDQPVSCICGKTCPLSVGMPVNNLPAGRSHYFVAAPIVIALIRDAVNEHGHAIAYCKGAMLIWVVH